MAAVMPMEMASSSSRGLLAQQQQGGVQSKRQVLTFHHVHHDRQQQQQQQLQLKVKVMSAFGNLGLRATVALQSKRQRGAAGQGEGRSKAGVAAGRGGVAVGIRASTNSAAAASSEAAASNSSILQAEAKSSVKSVMSWPVVTATPSDTVGDVLYYFAEYTGVPVVGELGHCIGMIANIDVAKTQRGRSGSVADTFVRDIMTSPAVVVTEDTPIVYAAGLMLKYKVHRLPVVNRENIVVGIITRRDIYQPLLPELSPIYHKVLGVDS